MVVDKEEAALEEFEVEVGCPKKRSLLYKRLDKRNECRMKSGDELDCANSSIRPNDRPKTGECDDGDGEESKPANRKKKPSSKAQRDTYANGCGLCSALRLSALARRVTSQLKITECTSLSALNGRSEARNRASFHSPVESRPFFSVKPPLVSCTAAGSRSVTPQSAFHAWALKFSSKTTSTLLPNRTLRRRGTTLQLTSLPNLDFDAKKAQLSAISCSEN